VDLNQYNVNLPLYKVNENRIYKIINTKGGDSYELEISTTPCVIIAKGRNIDTGEILYKAKFKDTFRHERIVWKRIRHLTKKTDVLELLNDGMFFQEKNVYDIIDYFFTYLKIYGNQLPEEIVVSKSGWKNKCSQFVIGNKLVSKDGVKDILQTDNPAVSMYSQEGDTQEWVAGVKYFFQFPAIRFKAYATFSPVLLKILEISNYLFEQCCKTGRLKSFSNKLCASMFGHPTKLQLDPDSTKVGLVKLTEACSNLPMFLDETSQNPAFILSLLYRFSNANTRVKSNTAQGLDISPDFSTAIFSTGEDPIVTEYAKGGQDARRVSEKIGVPEKVSVDIVNKAKMAFSNNYGHVAILFLQELFKEIDSITEIYTQFYKCFPESEDITSDRVKEYYFVLLQQDISLKRYLPNLVLNLKTQ
jgi:putative DNA primase/helicase